MCVQEKDAEYRTLTEEVETLRKNEITLNLNIAECADVSSIVYMYNYVLCLYIHAYTDVMYMWLMNLIERKPQLL